MPRGWLIPLIIVVGILAAIASGLMSRAVAADLLAWWPVWVLLILGTILGRNARIGAVRVAGLAPFAVTALLIVFVFAYYLAWPVMPSASISLVGPDRGEIQTAALSARVNGDVEIAAVEDGPVYSVEPLRQGGPVGAPSAMEQVQGSLFSTSLEPVADPGVYVFSGWSISILSGPHWSLALSGSIDLDGTTLSVTDLQLAGEGTVRLGTASANVPVAVDGVFTIVVPSNTPATVIGAADVPSTWQPTDDGTQSPVEGDGWVFSVSPGASLTVTHP